MIVTCEKCGKRYDDAHSWTICPHNPLDRRHDDVLCRRHDFFRPCPGCMTPGIGEVPVKWYYPVTGELAKWVIITHYELRYHDEKFKHDWSIGGG